MNFKIYKLSDYDRMPSDGGTYTAKPARYAKHSIAVDVARDGSGFKTTGMFLADMLNARYSNREQAYIMRESQFRKFQKLAEGKGVFQQVVSE